VVDIACPSKARMPRCRGACHFAGIFKSHGRVKSLVTVAGGFSIWAFTVNAPAGRLDYLDMHE
jgi:hypothetical protein